MRPGGLGGSEGGAHRRGVRGVDVSAIDSHFGTPDPDGELCEWCRRRARREAIEAGSVGVCWSNHPGPAEMAHICSRYAAAPDAPVSLRDRLPGKNRTEAS